MSCCSKRHHEGSAHEHRSSCCSSKKREAPASKQTIHKGMTIQNILDLFPLQAEALKREISAAGLHCIGCQAAVWETLEGGMATHGKTAGEADALVARLNALLHKQPDSSTISLTARAAAKFLEISSQENQLGAAIRFAAEVGGCGTLDYVLDFSEAATESDAIFTSHGIEIHTPKTQLTQLLGCEIDFVDDPTGTGFKITNPNARPSCGCRH